MEGVNEFTILEHVGELRKRLLRCVIALVITIAISFIFADRMFELLMVPLGGSPLHFIDVTEMISVYMKVCMAAGFVLAMPYLVYQVVMFVSPALTPREKKYVSFILPWIGTMFIIGVVFGYIVLLPRALDFLVNFGSDIASPLLRIGNYIDVVVRVLLAIGLVFELPVLTTFLARFGILKSRQLASKRKIAIVAAFLLAAFITPTIDPINQALVAAPLIILYEASIWLAKLVEKREPSLVNTISYKTVLNSIAKYIQR